MNSDLLNYCLSLKQKGLEVSDIERKLKSKGASEQEIKSLLKEADDLFISGQIE